MAVAAKAKEPASDSIMPPDKMRSLLALSKKEPVQAAIGLSSDGDGIILLDKKARPKKVFSMLRASAAKAKVQLNNATLRFGRAEVDSEYDAGMVRFFINKDAPGNMRVKLLEVVKRIPYQKVEINVDPTLEDEPEDETETQETVPEPGGEAGVVPPPAEPPPAAAPGADPTALARELAVLVRQIPTLPDAFAGKAGLVKLATDANVRLKTNNPNEAAAMIARLRDALAEPMGSSGHSTAPGEAAPTVASLTANLGGLARRIAGAAAGDAARLAALAKIANDANGAIKGNDLAAAAAAVARLREALDGPATPAGNANGQQANGKGPKVAFAQARLRYDAGRKHVHAEVEKLMAAMRTMFAGQPDFAAIDQAIGTFAGLRDLLDDKLMDALDAGYNAATDAAAAAAREAAVASIGEYQAFLASNSQLLEGMDTNPFVPVTVESVLPPLLADLASQLK